MRRLPPSMLTNEEDDDQNYEIIGESDSSEEEEEDYLSSGESSSDVEDPNDTSENDDKNGIDEPVINRRPLVGDEDVRAEGDYSSDEEHERNTIGNVPLHWYDEFDHIGYDKSGTKLAKSEGMDEVDKYLASKDDPYYRRTVYDEKNDRNIVLTDRELVMVRRMLESKFPEAGFDPEPDYNDYFSSVQMITPIGSAHEPKRRFVPSKWERMKIIKIANGIRAGTIQVGAKPPPKKPEFYLIWGEDDQIDDHKKRRGPKHIPAPKVTPPGHIESYHPPAEYLPTEEEIEEWKNAKEADRKLNFLPTDYKCLRKVPAYPDFVKERYERCLDLHMCPRTERRRLNIDPESLVPKLPKPEELRPYPTTIAVTYFGNYNTRVRALAVSPQGDLLASGADDCTVRIWEIDTGRCLAMYDLRTAKAEKEDEADDEDDISDYISKLAWNPNPAFRILAASIGSRIELLHAGVATAAATEFASSTFDILTGAKQETVDTLNIDDEEEREKRTEAIQLSEKIAQWSQHGSMKNPSDITVGSFCRTTISFKEENIGNVIDLAWHGKGEYLASVNDAKAFRSQVTIHHVTKRMSQRPLRTTKGERVQRILFHPIKPILFVAYKEQVDIFHLLKQVRMRSLPVPTRWISSMAIHPQGDNIIVGSYDRRLSWFDLEMSSKPFKTLKYHKLAIRQVCFHKRYPLMASCADDGNIHIFHAKVFDDFAKDPYVVPVKVLRGHTQTSEGLGVLDCVFHPTQPWIFTAGADGRIQLFQNIG